MAKMYTRFRGSFSPSTSSMKPLRKLFPIDLRAERCCETSVSMRR